MSDLIEQHTIDHIPEDQRFGTPRSLFTFWFTANTSAFTIVLGAIGIELGLNLLESIAAIVIGMVVGGLFMAYHSAQGPKLGLPQLIQGRAQFGFYGSLVPNSLIWIIFLGYIVAENVLASQALASLFHITFDDALALTAFVTWVVVVFGYRVMHDVNRVVAVVSMVLLVVLVVRLAEHYPTVHPVSSDFTVSAFILAISIFASGQIGWAPYVSDYSRYLPADTTVRKSFWYTYAGSVTSGILFSSLGALAGAVALSKVNGDAVGFLAGLVPGVGWLVTLMLLASIVAGNAINLYSPLVSGLALVSKDGGRAPSVWVRSIGSGVIMAGTAMLAVAVSANFLTDLSDFAASLLYVVVPWSSINLIDYYFVRRGEYDLRSILSPGGIYGKFKASVILVFLTGFAAEIPFMNSSWPKFEGPVASALSGADISWLVGFIVAGGLYYGLAALRGTTRDLVGSRAWPAVTLAASVRGEVPVAESLNER